MFKSGTHQEKHGTTRNTFCIISMIIKKGGTYMLRNDIEQVWYTHRGSDRPLKITLDSVIGHGSKINMIDFEDVTKICRLHHEDGTTTIIANTEFLMLSTKNRKNGNES